MNKLELIIAILIAVTLQGCDQVEQPRNSGPTQPSNVELNAFIAEIKKNMVFVEGGEFLMGDFGMEYAPERLPYDREKHSKPLHKVALSSYSISRYKVTTSEYQFYLKYNGMMPKITWELDENEWARLNSIPNIPAPVDWYESDGYCNWLADITGLSFSLPTEAQWEYAARSRGQFLMVATDDGTYKAEPRHLRTETYIPKGINISSYGSRMAFAKEKGWKEASAGPLPVNMFPPNPLGLYSMTDNGMEWVKDWYDPNYYQYSPIKDPQGPDRPVFKDVFGRYTKVLRGQPGANPYWGGGVNVFRGAREPLGSIFESGEPVKSDKTVRCVVNSPDPITEPLSLRPSVNDQKVK